MVGGSEAVVSMLLDPVIERRVASAIEEEGGLVFDFGTNGGHRPCGTVLRQGPAVPSHHGLRPNSRRSDSTVDDAAISTIDRDQRMML